MDSRGAYPHKFRHSSKVQGLLVAIGNQPTPSSTFPNLNLNINIPRLPMFPSPNIKVPNLPTFPILDFNVPNFDAYPNPTIHIRNDCAPMFLTLHIVP